MRPGAEPGEETLESAAIVFMDGRATPASALISSSCFHPFSLSSSQRSPSLP